MRDFHQRGHDNDDIQTQALITATARAWPSHHRAGPVGRSRLGTEADGMMKGLRLSTRQIWVRSG